MPELLDFDKDLAHLEAASKVWKMLFWYHWPYFITHLIAAIAWVLFFRVFLGIFDQIQLKSLAEEMQAVSKGLEKVDEELTASESDGVISAGFQKVS